MGRDLTGGTNTGADARAAHSDPRRTAERHAIGQAVAFSALSRIGAGDPWNHLRAPRRQLVGLCPRGQELGGDDKGG